MIMILTRLEVQSNLVCLYDVAMGSLKLTSQALNNHIVHFSDILQRVSVVIKMLFTENKLRSHNKKITLCDFVAFCYC